MNVLILGGTGFLSSALVAESLRGGHTVTVVTRGRAGRSDPPPGVETLHADRSDPIALAAALAGRVFDLVIDSILFKPQHARDAVQLFWGRVGCYVFISTDFVYGGEPRTYPITEDAPRHALNPYGADKAACEDILLAAGDFPAVVLRPPHILGAGGLLGTGSREGRDAWLLWRMQHGHPLFLLDGGSLLIQPVHKTDIARAALAVAAAPLCVKRAYNMAGRECVTTRHYYDLTHELLQQQTGETLPPLRVVPLSCAAYLAAQPDKAAFCQNRVYSLSRLQTDAAFTPALSLRDALADVVADLLAKGLPEGTPPDPDIALADLLESQIAQAAEALARG